ncbi:hypothetical protein TWF694_010165 [Orbilia ellipsospora]|uniref:Uncharacterized protein n=1 Tax=Orbilia ellipsospora TaxID=2528407 RepID=A0AAV9XA90_9PEZI
MCDKTSDQEGNAGNAIGVQCPSASLSEIDIPSNVDITAEVRFATNNFPEDEPPSVFMSINGVNAGAVQMDTGSTTITIGKQKWIEKFNGNWDTAINCKPGWKFLSSSRLLYSGYWVPTILTFQSEDGKGNFVDRLKSTVPVLVYDVLSLCPLFTNEQGGTCTKPTWTQTTNLDGLYMGVGFGREQQGGCTPDKNPLLNVQEVNGQNIVGSGNYRLGYILSATSLIWGLTATNIQGFNFTKLTLRQPTPYDDRDWAMATMTVSVNGGPFRQGPLLVDTGVKEMFLSSPDVPDPLLPSFPIDFQIPGTNGSLGGYTVTALDNDGHKSATSSIELTAPSLVDPTPTKPSGPEPVFLNTGSRFFYAYETAFDAAGGNWGTKPLAS